MNDSGKTNPKLPFFILETLQKDSITFQMRQNTIFNLVYENLRDKFQYLEVDVSGKYDKKKNLSLQNEFSQEFIDIEQYEISKKYNINEAEYFRSLLYQYSKLPVFEREKVLFHKNYKKLKDAIKKEQQIRVYLKSRKSDGPRDIEPYFMACSEEFQYLFGYCLMRKEYRVFRLSHIEKIHILEKKIEYKDVNEIVEYRENFDPFLSFGKQVKVRFTEEGKQKYQTIIGNRPKAIKVEGEIYTLECSEMKAQIYFPQFFTTVEILEPQSLRDWYKGKLEEALSYYK